MRNLNKHTFNKFFTINDRGGRVIVFDIALDNIFLLNSVILQYKRGGTTVNLF